MGPPGLLAIWGEGLFIFRELRSTGKHFRGAGEQAHSFGDLGSPTKKKKINLKNLTIKENLHIVYIFKKKFFDFFGADPLVKCKCIFGLTFTSGLTLEKNMANNACSW